MTNPSAGIGDPYWYEWSVGLEYVIDLLDVDSGVNTVTLQKTGAKGLDDVVVAFADGRRRYIQVKHTREQDTLTFGDFVCSDDKSPSLLRQLAQAWSDEVEPTEVWLVTNRAAGTRAATTSSPTSVSRPPLDAFLQRLASEVQNANTFDDLSILDDWADAWNKEWLPQLDVIDGDDGKLRFLRALQISHSEEGLNELGNRLCEKLSSLFKVDLGTATKLRARLDSALRIWATSNRGNTEAITKEAVYEKLCLVEDSFVGEHDLAPPAPFFSSRLIVLDEVRKLLADRSTPVVFVVGEPGSGKTALFSEIAVQRKPTVAIDVRFHAYRPITPENQLLPADAGRTSSPRALWSDLLLQLQTLARGRLAELEVPIHAGSLTVDQLRGHVLRIANSLGSTEGRPFVIAVDGIDHAARSGTAQGSFLDTLVPPDQVPSHVVFLIGGQPPEAYQSYPAWLRTETTGVQVVSLPRLDLNDTAALVRARLKTIAQAEQNVVARDVFLLCKGHTLSTVFAVEEASLVGTDLAQLAARLNNRQISSSIEQYYEALWSSVTANLPAPTSTTAARLAACLTLSPIRTTSEMVAHVAHTGMPAANWADVLRALKPLVVEENGGFRVFHNDVRVFLLCQLKGDPAIYRECASLLADHLLEGADVVARHAAAQNLLGISQRRMDQAALFTPEYVIEGHAIGQSIDLLTEQGIVAAESLAALDPNWDLAHQVVNGLCTLEQLRRCLDSNGSQPAPEHKNALASTRPAERRVPARKDWTPEAVNAALNDMAELCRLNEHERAKAAFERWFQGMSPRDVCAAAIKTLPDDQHGWRETAQLVRKLGGISARTCLFLPMKANEHDGKPNAFYAGGFLDALDSRGTDRAFVRTLMQIQHYFVDDVVNLLLRLVGARAWRRCALLLQYFHPPDDHVPFRLIGATIATLLGDPRLRNRWTARILAKRQASIESAVAFEGKIDNVDQLTVMSWTAILLGIEERSRDPGNIREEIQRAYAVTSRNKRNDSAIAEILHASALLGSLVCAVREIRTDATFVDVVTVAHTVECLFTASERHRPLFLPYQYPRIAAEIARGIVECAEKQPQLRNAVQQVLLAQIQTGKWLGDFLPTMWRSLHRAGHRSDLTQYADIWIGLDGEAWAASPDERQEIVGTMIGLLEEIGEAERANAARDHLVWMQIGYVGRKEYALDRPLEWFNLIAKSDPSVWKGDGLRLLAFSREASSTADNRLSSEIESSVLAAACTEGPESLAKLLLVENSFFEPGASAVVDGLLRTLERRPLGGNDLLALWSFCTGRLCWQVYDDRHELADARDALVAASQKCSKTGLADAMRNMAPAEFACEHANDSNTFEAGHHPDYEQMPLNQALALACSTPDWTALPAIIERAKSQDGDEFNATVDTAWSLLLSRPERLWQWDGAGRAYAVLMPLVAPKKRWNAVTNAVVDQTHDKLAFRTQTLAENLDGFCRLQASLTDDFTVSRGLRRILDMHEQWLTGCGRFPPPNEVPVAAEAAFTEWRTLLLELLFRLLEFDEQSYVQATLRGIHRLLTIDPSLYQGAISRIRASKPGVQERFLLVTEVLAASEDAGELRDWLQELVECPTSDLSFALSAWSALQLSHLAIGTPKPSWPEPTQKTPLIQRVAPPLFVSASSQKGLYSTPGRPTTRILKFLRHACLDSVDDIESEFAASIRDDPPPTRDPRRQTNRARDLMLIARDEGEIHRFFAILRRHERAGRFANVPIQRLVQALSAAADPFVFLQTPAAHSKPDLWLTGRELDDLIEQAPLCDERLASLLTSDLSETCHLLGGTVQTFSERWDVRIVVGFIAGKHEEPSPNDPLCILNPRASLTFLDFNELMTGGNTGPATWLMMTTGGLFPFTDAVVDPFPATCWRKLGWRPTTRDPLQWEKDGVRVAWFERQHGPVRHIYRSDFAYRQPLLSRWACTDAAWTQIAREYGEPVRQIVVQERAPSGIR